MRKLIVALAVCGVAVSSLALWAHYSASPLPFDGGVFSHSGLSMVGPIPVAAIGVAGFLSLALLAWFRRQGWTLLFSWIGLGFAAYLSYLEVHVLRSGPLYCVISQCLIALVAILATIGAIMDMARRASTTVSSMVDWIVTSLRYG